MRLGFHYHVPAVPKPEGIYMPGYLGRFIDSLAGVCEGVVCFLHTPRPDELNRMDYRITSPNVRLVGIGTHASTMQRTLQAGRYTSFLRQHASDLDLLLVRGPSPLLPAMVSASPVPTALLLVGDYLAGINDLPQPRWRKEVIRLWARWNKWAQDRAARRSLTFVNSHVLYLELQGRVADLHEIRTTTLTKDDFFERADTCVTRPVHLLYTGRLSEMKGLFDILEALFLLVQRGEDVTFELVGAPDPGEEDLTDRLMRRADELGIRNRIHFSGYKSIGPELFDRYRAADIYVTASRLAEGFPRTIWEAMAHSLPVVATRVGSIPDYAEGAAKLVEPRNASALAGAIQKVIRDQNLRQRLIRNGWERALQNTLENRTQEMMGYLIAYVVKQEENDRG